MLEELLEESVSHLEQDFYAKDFRFSYSSLSKLLYSPAVFYQMYILGHKDEKMTPSLLEGKVIHCLLLEQNYFDKYFVVSPAKLPTAQAKDLVDSVYFRVKNQLETHPELGFEDFRDTILEQMVKMNYYQNLNSDNGRIDKVVTAETKSYFEFLKQKGSKDLIDQQTYDYCQSAVEIVKQHPKVMTLLGRDVDDFSNVEVFNEFPVECSIKGLPFGFKGIIDNLKIDHDKKLIYINDFKTSGKTLKEFKDSIEYYSYWLQAVLYLMMVSHQYYDLLQKGYDIKFHFIVIDRYFNVYPFPVSDLTRNNWLERFHAEVLPVAAYHYTSRRYELPYEFDNELVIL